MQMICNFCVEHPVLPMNFKTTTMKKLFNLTLCTLLFMGVAFSQEIEVDTTIHSAIIDEVAVESEAPMADDSLTIIKQEELRTIGAAKSDTILIRLGNKRVVIIEKEGSTTIEVPEDTFKDSNKDRSSTEKYTYKQKKRFRGHWAGVQWGFNGLMDPNFSLNMTGDNKYLELRQGRSWNFNINPIQYSFGLGTNYAGIVTGLGFEFNNYIFRNPVSLMVDNGITVEDDSYALDPNKNVKKSRFSTSHITVPLLFEFQIPTSQNRHRIFFSAGVIGGVKIGSHTKVVYDGVRKGKDKTRDDFNLSTFRYGVTAQIGYRAIKLFATYYPTGLFEKGKGPEVYPFSVGLTLLNF